MKKRGLILIILALIFGTIPALAHSGRTDAQGGHYVGETEEYHFHHGHRAHQHPNGICPYGGKDISRSNGSSSDNSSSSNSTSALQKNEGSPNNSENTSKTASISGEYNKTPPYKSILNVNIEEENKEDSVSYMFFLFGILGIAVLLLVWVGTGIYNKVYGNARANVRNIEEKIKHINKQYSDIFKVMQLLNHTGSADDAHLIQKHAESIMQNLKDLRALYSKKELIKYLSEDERQMKFKKISQEMNRLEGLCHLIETKYYGKTQLTLPRTNTESTTSTKIIFLYIKSRRQDSKARYFHCPAKIKCTKTVTNTENAYGESLKHSVQTTYEIIDFYFSNNSERKPAEPGKLNHFENIQQKGFVNTIKDGKSEAFEVILTEEDATADYRANQIIDTVRKVAKDENLTAKVKKTIKGLKLSYTPPKPEK